MDTSFKILLGVVSVVGVFKLLRMGGAQKAALQETADKKARKDVADAKAMRRSIRDRR
jgi:hypothetical protein